MVRSLFIGRLLGSSDFMVSISWFFGVVLLIIFVKFTILLFVVFSIMLFFICAWIRVIGISVFELSVSAMVMIWFGFFVVSVVLIMVVLFRLK